jgi:tryptophan aminotransferase
MGKPNPETFPITSISFTARTPNADGTDSECELMLKHQDLEEALQYGPTAGLPGLRKWLLGLQERVHERAPGEDWTLTCGAGGQDLLYKVDIFPS